MADEPAGGGLVSPSGEPLGTAANAAPPSNGGGAAILDVTDATFEQEVIARSRELPVIVDFWAPWCGPCRVISPILEKIATEKEGELELVKLNTDENPQTASQFGIEGIPAVKAFANGQVITEFTGALPEEQIRSFFDSLTPSEADRKAAEGYRLMQEGQLPLARLQLEAALEAEPNHEFAGLGLAQLMLALGDTARAGELAGRWPSNPIAKALLGSMRLHEVAEGHDPNVLRQRLEDDPSDADAHYRLGCVLALLMEWEQALEHLLEAVKLDRALEDDGARERMLDVFGVLGDEHPLTVDYRKRLGSVLF